jgi:hypothetical protein
MLRKTVLALIATTGVLAAAVAFTPNAPVSIASPVAFMGESHHNPRQMTGKLLESCLDEPVGCGLIVW